MLKKKVTNKKFYGKWLYKVSLSIPGIVLLRTKTLDELSDNYDYDKNGRHLQYGTFYKAKNNQDNIKRTCKLLKELDATEWFRRIESDCLDVYTNNVDVYNNICKELNDIIINHFEPDGNILENSNSYTIVSTKLPHNKYRYKVYLRPHNLAGDKEAKYQFLNWVDMQGERILISQTVKDWFITTDWNWDRRYLLVEDEQTLLLLKMRSAAAIGKAYEYKIVDK
jgi:hypothetical protein